MAFGFMANESIVSGIVDFYDVAKPIKLVGSTSVDSYARVVPQSAYLSQLDLSCTVTSGTMKCVKALLTWDSTGDDPLFRETPSERFFAGVTTGTKANAVIPIQTFLTAPSTQTNLGEVYLWLKTDGATITLDVARLQWATRRVG